MEPGLVTATNLTHFHGLTRIVPICHVNLNLNRLLCAFSSPSRISVTSRKASRSWVTFCSSNPSKSSDRNSVSTANRIEETLDATLAVDNDESQQNRLRVEVGSPTVLSYLSTAKLSLSDQAFFLLTFIACTTSVAFTSLVIAAIPTLFAMCRAAISLSKLADTAREELPSTMAAVRLSGMEISDLTLELSDLSHEIADGVSKSSQAFEAADAGIRQIGSLARQQTMSMIQERAELPIISLQPVVAGAAKKTSRAVGQATKTFMNLISRGELSSENENKEAVDRLEI